MNHARTSSSALPGIIVTAVFTVVGVLGLAVTAWVSPAALTQVASQTAQTTAAVTEVHVTEQVVYRRDSDGHSHRTIERTCIARYTYTVDGQAYQRTSTQCSLKQGETVPMHYQPGLPGNAALDVDRDATGNGVWIGYGASALFIAIGLGVGAFTFRSSLAAGRRAAARVWRRLFGAKPAALEPDGYASQVLQPGMWEQPNAVEPQESGDPAH